MMKKLFLLLLILPVLTVAKTPKENDPRYQYYVCVSQQAIKYSRSTEPAETAATAAIQSCLDSEEKAVDAAAPGQNPMQKRNTRELFREQTLPFAIKIIMDERMKRQSP
ncbi:TPA: hypothetical protein ACIGWT_004479 [Citrobacter amalonaticus]